QVANALECLGLQQGDAIAIDMLMNVYAVTAYLAIILAGMCWSFDSRVVEAQGPLAIVIPADGKSMGLQLREGDRSWDDFLSCSNHLSRPHEYKAVVQPIEAHPNILFSSGTTGQ
ncbi:unnamed protein product, partial [Sphagnum troendelagicum]